MRTPKPLVSVGGRPIINHVLDRLYAAGVTHATVVAGYRAEKLRSAIDQLHPCGMDVNVVENSGFMLGNARSLWAARRAVDGPFLLCMSDHLIDPEITRSLLAAANGRCMLAVDHVTPDDERASEATRGLVRDGLVMDLGKDIDEWNALDTGAFYCTPVIFDALTRSRRDGELGAVFASLAHRELLDAVDVTGYEWLDIDTPDDLASAHLMIAAGSGRKPEPRDEVVA
jgi:choline kinase